jgi:hypothetical protein
MRGLGLGMLSYTIEEDEGVIVLSAVGETTFDDLQAVSVQFFADVRSSGIRRILVDWREFTGWRSDDAKSISYHSWLNSRSLFDRVALVVRSELRDEALELEELFRNADKDIRRFAPRDYDAALDWLINDESDADASD